MPLNGLKPAVPKHWLIAIAGGVWLAAGIVLLRLAWAWQQTMPLPHKGGLLAAGVLLALALHRFLLSRLVRRNVARIDRYAEKGCLFAFQAWRSYLLILVMVALGAFLRHTALPREILAVLYSAMGAALCMASLTYFSALKRRGSKVLNRAAEKDPTLR